MPAKAVADAFQTRLGGETWNGYPIIDDPLGSPPDVDAFLVLQYPLANGERPVLGRRFFEEGAARIVLNIKASIGKDQGLEWSDTIATLFRAVKFSDIETFAPSPPLINDATDDGNWLSFAVIVPYRYQFDG